MLPKKINNSFFPCTTKELAKKLLGKVIVRELNGEFLIGRIVEAEAYLDKNDFASHSAVGLTKRNEVMFGEAGLIYIYFTYGMHYCFNIVSGEKGKGSAVLIRAVEPLEGIEVMFENRKIKNFGDLTNGPSKFCQAFKIEKSMNGIDLKKSEKIFIADSNDYKFEIGVSRRIGIVKSSEKMLRFFIKGNKFLSRR